MSTTNTDFITSSTNAVGTVGNPFSYQIAVSSPASGFGATNLPLGLLPPGTNGIIQGLPQTAGIYTSTISATTSQGLVQTNLFLRVNAPAAPSAIIPTSVISGQNESLVIPLASSPSHSNVPTTFSVSNLPLGLGVFSNVTTNVSYPQILVTNYFIAGIPLASGSFEVPVTVANNGSANPQTSTSNITFVINPPAAPEITSPDESSAVVGVPFRFDVTAKNAPRRFRARVAGSPNWVTNGVLTNGFVFSEVGSGGQVVGRISGTPGLSGVTEIEVQALNDENADDAVPNPPPSPALQTLKINVEEPKPTVVLSQPLAEGDFVLGSSFFLNAQVFDNPDDIIVPSSVGFTVDGVAVTGIVQQLGEFYGVEFYPETALPFIVRASGQNLFGERTTSFPLDMRPEPPQRPLPIVEILPLNPGTPVLAGGQVTLRARAAVASSATTIDRVEFYVNKTLVGFALAPVPFSNDEFEFRWTTPEVPGTFEVHARAVSVNFTRGNPPIPFWASTVTRKPVVVNTRPGTPPNVAIMSPENGDRLDFGVPNRIVADANVAGSSIDYVEFFANGRPVEVDPTAAFPFRADRAPYAVDFIPLSYGTYELFAIATAANGQQTVSPTVVVTAPSGTPPAVAITSPATDSTVPQGPISIRWVASDRDGSVQRAELRVNGEVAVDSNGNPLVIDRANDPAANPGSAIARYLPPSEGRYVFVVRVADNLGNVADSEPVIVTVDNSSPNILPIVSMTHPVPAGLTEDGQSDDVNDFSLPSQLFFNALVTLPEGVSVDVEDVAFFSSGRRLVGTVTRFDDTFAFRWQPQATGDYFISAQVIDSRGFEAVSEPLFFQIGDLVRPLPSIELLDLGTSQAAAGSTIIIQAKTNQGTTRINRIDFYANGAFLGTAEPRQANNTDITTVFAWSPPTPGVYSIAARAVQTIPGGVRNGADNSVISNSRTLVVTPAAGVAPTVILLPQPIAETRYVSGSQLFLNAAVEAAPQTIIPEDGVKFYYGGNILSGIASGVRLGSQEVFSARVQASSAVDIPVFATASDSRNVIGSSDSTSLEVVQPLRPLPTVSMLPLSATGPFSAGEEILLRAQAVFPSPSGADSRVEFYGNGAYLGAGEVNPDDPREYSFVWESPARGGDFSVVARAVSLNFQTNTGNDNSISYYNSVISLNSVNVSVQAVPESLAPGSNGAFVVEMYQNLIYRDPTFQEWFSAVARLDGGASRAGFVMALMGYSETTQIFNRAIDYGRTSAVAFSIYARLGLAPTTDRIRTFLLTMEADRRPLPIIGTYTGVPNAPWGATYGMATATQAVFDAADFQFKYPDVTGLPDQSFLQWMNVVMFPNRSGGDEPRILTMMETIVPQRIRFGAAAAFRNQLATYALAGSQTGLGFDNRGSAREKTFQRQLGTAMLQFQIGGPWRGDLQNLPLYSEAVVQNLLAQYASSGGMTAGITGVAAARVTRYQGVIGSGLLEEPSIGPDQSELRGQMTSSQVEAWVQGGLSVSIRQNGSYSGALRLDDGTVYRGRGRVDQQGAIDAYWSGPRGGAACHVQLQRARDGGGAYLVGSVARSGQVWEAVVAQQTYSARTNPLPHTTPQSLVLNARDDVSQTEGTGFGRVTFTRSGMARMAGRLPDGGAFTASVPVWGATPTSGETGLLLHRMLYRGQGSLGGMLFRRPGDTFGQGTFHWRAPANASNEQQPVAALEATLSDYNRPAAGQLPLSWGRGSVVFRLTWWNSIEAKTADGQVMVISANRLLGTSHGLELRIHSGRGTVSGFFIDPVENSRRAIRGVVDQHSNSIKGLFFGPETTGKVEVEL